MYRRPVLERSALQRTGRIGVLHKKVNGVADNNGFQRRCRFAIDEVGAPDSRTANGFGGIPTPRLTHYRQYQRRRGAPYHKMLAGAGRQCQQAPSARIETRTVSDGLRMETPRYFGEVWSGLARILIKVKKHDLARPLTAAYP